MKIKTKPIYKDDRYTYRSFIELYFSYYLNELKESGFVENWWYEVDTFKLSDPIKGTYFKELKSKVKVEEYHLLREASLTADFTIKWNINSVGLFLFWPIKLIQCKITDIPFHIGKLANDNVLWSYVETKGNNESSTSSSISFAYTQKWVYQLHGIFIQKIKPFGYKRQRKILFQDTFTPKKVIELEVYVNDCKWGKRGESKLHYPVRTLEEYLKLRGYE